MMEGVGAEISQKIKSAIKAKLMEIGAFVDDELPDYIMVMVANKRTKAQMNDDLSLFLGNNTNHFTSWLHSVLEQLKQVTLISQTAAKEQSKRKHSTSEDESEKKRKKKDKGSKESSHSQNSSLHSSDITDKIKQELMTEYSKESVKAPDSSASTSTKSKQSSEISVQNSVEKGVVNSSPEITEIKLEESTNGKKHHSTREDVPVPPKKSKRPDSSDEIELSDEGVTPGKDKEVFENGEKDVTLDKEDSISLELSSDENEYINIRNDDIFLSGDEDLPPHRHSTVKSLPSKIINVKSNDPRSSRKYSSSKEPHSRKEKPTIEKSRSHSKDDRRSSNRDSLSNRGLERTSSSKLDLNSDSSGKKKVLDAREVLNRKRNMKKTLEPDNEKSKEDNSSRSKSIFDRLAGKKSSERSSEHPSSESKARTSSSREPVRSKDISESSRNSSRPSVVSEDKSSSRIKRTISNEQSNAASQSKRQVISISQIAESERQLLRGSQKVATVKPQVLSRSHLQSSSKSHSHDLPRNHSHDLPRNHSHDLPRNHSHDLPRSHSQLSSKSQSQVRRKEKPVENRIASRVVAKEPEPESDIEEITVDVPSVVKVTPRPVIPTEKAAPRNLILKAVAEAEKSVQSSPRSDMFRSKERESARLKEKFAPTISPACISITLPNDRVGALKDIGAARRRKIDDGDDENIAKNAVKPSLEVFKMYQSSRGGGRTLNRSLSPPRRPARDVSTDEFEEEFTNDSDSIELNISENTLPDEELDFKAEKTQVIRNPSFIVTMNNLDPVIKARAESEENKAVNVNRVKPQRILINSDRLDDSSNESSLPIVHKAVSPVIISVSPSSPESNDDTNLKRSVSPSANSTPVVTSSLPSKVTNKVADICKFWPNCLAGEKCPFVHITTTCVNFPNCKFGNRCLYSHPKCKFLSACVRKNCPYSHPTASLPLSIPSLSNQMCKFYPQCTNISCSFFHPKPCKFGANCVTKDCVFAHSNSFSGNKFKWSKSSNGQPLSFIL